MPKVSLIILVYNTEHFIERSLRSALEQTFGELEVILVNDATPDGSMAVIERVLAEYPARRGQVHIFTHPQNMGCAAARQTGLDHATGEYTIHLDSDDYCEATMIEELYARAKQEDADIVFCDYYENYPTREIYRRQTVPASGRVCAARMLDGSLSCALWNKLVRRELYTKHHITTAPGVNVGEDLFVTVRLCHYAGHVSYLDKAFVHYVKYNPRSYITNMSERSVRDIQAVLTLLTGFFRENGALGEYETALNHRKISIRMMLLFITRGRRRRESQRLYPEATPCIFSFPCTRICYKFALWFAAHKLWPLTCVILWGVRTAKKCKALCAK